MEAAEPENAGQGRLTTPAAVPNGQSSGPGIVRAELAPETLRLYARGWARFQKFCAERGERALPASPDLVASFLATASCGKAGLSRRLAAVDHQHRQRGLTPPGHDPGLRAALRQARQVAPVRRRAPAPSPTQLERLAQSCRGDLVEHRDRALLLLLAAGLGRTAIVALQTEHLRFSEHGLALGLANGTDTAPPFRLTRAASAASCPVRAVEDWLRASGTRYGPVFRKISRWGQLEHPALGADAIRLILARRAAAPPRPGRDRR